MGLESLLGDRAICFLNRIRRLLPVNLNNKLAVHRQAFLAVGQDDGNRIGRFGIFHQQRRSGSSSINWVADKITTYAGVSIDFFPCSARLFYAGIGE